MSNISDDFIKTQFTAREGAIEHPTYDDELAFYDMIKSGNINALKKHDFGNADDEARGILSKDKVRNLRYHLIVSVAMITRFCIEGGMPEQDAYTLSDTYINKLDITTSINGLRDIQQDFVFDFAKRMKHIQKQMTAPQSVLSIHTTQAMDYVYNHLHDTITVVDVADAIGINETYLSKLFKKETGQSLSSYIRKKRIQTAQNMLVYSNYSCADIAQYLAFSSSSHFASIFKEETGMTPLKYRRENYRKHWDVKNERTNTNGEFQ